MGFSTYSLENTVNIRKFVMMMVPTIATLGVLKVGRNLPVVKQVRDFVL